jgi:hypothetical protein
LFRIVVARTFRPRGFISALILPSFRVSEAQRPGG